MCKGDIGIADYYKDGFWWLRFNEDSASRVAFKRNELTKIGVL